MHPSEPLLTPEDDLGLLCHVIANGINDAVLARLETAGFGDARVSYGFVVQGLLAGDTTVTELAQRLGISVQAVSKTVQEMEQHGYVEGDTDPSDRRSRRLRLSARAVRSVAKSRQARFHVQQDVLEALGAGRAEATLETLRMLADRLGGMEALATRRLRPGS